LIQKLRKLSAVNHLTSIIFSAPAQLRKLGHMEEKARSGTYPKDSQAFIK
jgi:hypothetical protein